MLFKLALGPVLLWQARGVRQRALILPEPEGEREGVVQGAAASALRLLIVGDSSAAGVGCRTQDEALAGHLSQMLMHASGRTVHWQLVARSGVASPRAVTLLDEHTLRESDVAVVVVGVNDVAEQLPIAAALAARETLVQRLRERSRVRHVVFAPLPPMHQFPLLPQPLRTFAGREARRLNAAQAAWAARQQAVTHVHIDDVQLGPHNMAADGYHPGPAVYRHCAQAIAQHIAQRVLPGLRVT
ncbi:MAG TPA: SGNH/GDSL hydrolase family protein [Burkholderiaceae bacterium]|nr:SGNH/GDSL hydrolase family protein [Burkholderiaceae bacterium]